MPNLYTGLVSLYLAVVLLGANGLFAKSIPLDAVTITQLRSAIAAVVLLLFCIQQRQPLGFKTPRSIMGIYGLGMMMGLHWVTFFHAMQVSSVAIGLLALYTYPVITVCLEPVFERKLPSIADILAASVVLLGVLLLIPEWDLSNQVALGVFWGVVSALLFAGRNVLQRRYFAGSSSSRVMLHQVLLIGCLLLPWSDLHGAMAMSLNGWLLLLACGVVTTAVAHTLFSMGLRVLSAKSVGLISCLQPVVGVILAWLVLQEQPDWRTLIGGCLIVTAAAYESYKVRA